MNIKNIREKLYLTQEEFGRLVGVVKQTVYRWEQGIKEPTLRHKRKIIEICKENGFEDKFWEK